MQNKMSHSLTDQKKTTSFQFPAEMKVKSSALETTAVPRGQNISQSQEYVVQRVNHELHEQPRVTINV